MRRWQTQAGCMLTHAQDLLGGPVQQKADKAPAQERMRAGPHFAARLNPRLLAAITENPELLQAIMARTGVELDADEEAAPQVGCAIA